MPLRPLSRLLCVAALVLTTALPAHGPRARASARGVQVGVLTTAHDPHVASVLAGIRAGFSLAGMEPDVLEKTAGGDPSVARATVMEFAFEGPDVIFALGPDAAQLARDSLRERSVVFAAVGYPDALGLPGRGNVCGVAGGVAAKEIVHCIRRTAPSVQRIGLASNGGTEAAFIMSRVAKRAAEDGFETVRLPTPESDADEACTIAEASLGAVWFAPDVPVSRVQALAGELEGTRIALIGSRRDHLDAGCSVVLRADPTTQGLHAAALARRVLDGEAPEEIGVRHVQRHRLEVSLDAARRLGHELPLPVLAAADHLVPSYGRRR